MIQIMGGLLTLMFNDAVFCLPGGYMTKLAIDLLLITGSAKSSSLILVLTAKSKAKVCCLNTTPWILKHSLGSLQFNYSGYSFPTPTPGKLGTHFTDLGWTDG